MRMRRLAISLMAAIAATLLGCSTVSPRDVLDTAAALKPATHVTSLLWVGNSFFYYNNSMHGHVGQLLAASGGKGFRASSATISGSGLNWHDVGALLRADNGVSSYSFVGDNQVRFNPRSGKKFDAVMMMDCSQCPIHPDLKPLFHEFAARHSVTARRFGSEPIFFMSWAYADKPEMTEALAAEYVKAGRDNKALVVPVGLAFAASVSARPDIGLTMADKRHPSLAGTYLAACTVLASVYKRNPLGNAYGAGLSADVAAHLQTIAWKTAQDFHTREGRGGLP